VTAGTGRPESQPGVGRTPAGEPLFTGWVSSLPMYDPGPPSSAYWRGTHELRADLRISARIVAVLALVGIPAGLAWWALAPRAVFRITADGPEPLGSPSTELLIADDAFFALVLAVVGLMAGAAVWRLRRRRGVASVVAVAVGALTAAVVAWQVGELLGAGPTEEQLADVGARVTTPLTLGSSPALAVAPFLAVLAYVVAAVFTHDDGLGRTAESSGQPEPAAAPAAISPERSLVDVPPAPGWPSA
jgi:hypothetical protein